MTATATEIDAGLEGDHAHDGHSDITYWKVGGFLALITALETSTYWLEESTIVSAAILVMMVIKFTVVALYFMHLKDDESILSKFFIGGIVLALAVYFGALGSMVIFDDGGNNEFPNPPREREAPAVVVEQSALLR